MNRDFLIILGLICLSAVAIAGCDKKSPAGFERPPAPVSVATAVTETVPVYIDNVGKTVATEVVSIQPQVSGRITKIHFEDGADLKKGDMLFTIDPRPYEAALHSAEATLAQNKAQLDLAKLNFDRYAELLKTESVSQQDYDQRKSAFDVAEAQVQQSEAAVETARINLDYCFIHSPIDGRAGQRLVDVGNVVTFLGNVLSNSSGGQSGSGQAGAGQPGVGDVGAANTGSLLVIERSDPIYVDFTITENDLTQVQQNMRQGTLKVEVRVPDEPNKPREGKLTFLDNTVQGATGTVKLRATLPNSDHYFWPGRFVKVRLVLSTLHGAVLIPSVATQMSANGPFVYVIKDDSTAELRPVKLGQRHGELVVVDEGVKAGERVVTKGQLGVMPGGQVHIEGPGSGAEKEKKS